MKKTKIICSIGPSTQKWENFKGIVEAGMNVARINFSHATLEERKLDEDLVKRANEELGSNIAILYDTKGPDLRTCTFKEVKQSTLYLVITARAGAGGASEAPAPQHACDTHLSPRCVCVSWRLPAASGPSRELIGSRSQPASASTGPSTVAGTPCTSSLIPTCTDADTDQLRENPVSSPTP